MVYNLKQPMTWAVLKAMPSDLQKQYLERLQEKYHANTLVISQMLGIGAQALRTLAASLGVTFPRGGGGKMSDTDCARWQAFLQGDTSVISTEVAKETPEPAPVKPKTFLASGTMTFRGPVDDILTQTRVLLGDRVGCVTISWEFEEEDQQ